MDCYHYRPHYHPERLNRIPSADIVFVCGNGDIAFCEPEFTREIIQSIKGHGKQKHYYFQSKQPEYFQQFLSEFPNSVILVTTLETNRDAGYERVSKAPPPSVRYRQFKSLDWPQKVVTIEPVMDFDVEVFGQWIVELNPLYVWLGFNSRPKEVKLPEPSKEKVLRLRKFLNESGVAIKEKDLRQQ
jgi:hypothetical protein